LNDFSIFFCIFAPNIQLKYVFIMARPIAETPVLSGGEVTPVTPE
jgi:hypothetical protein